jgi:glycosyltransferase involved in cell wall biosynthesis
MEAQSAGLPVVVTDQGGPGEVVDRGVTGFVLPADASPDTTARWVDTLVRLIGSPDLRRTMGAAAHAKIQPMSIAHSFRHFWEVHETVAADVGGVRVDAPSTGD